MKKHLLLTLTGLLVWLLVGSAIAQTPTVTPDLVLTTATPVSLATTPQPEPPKSQNLRRIPVKAGDLITVSAMVFDKTPRNRQLWQRLAKAVVPGFIVGGFARHQTTAPGDQRLANSTTFGASLAVVPGAIELLKKHGQARTFIGLMAYDSDGELVKTVKAFMTKAARKDWEKLEVSYQAEKDGVVEITENEVESKKVATQTGMIASIKRSTTDSLKSSYPKNSDDSNADYTSPGGSSNPPKYVSETPKSVIIICIDWYWVSGVSATWVDRTCEVFGGGAEGGGGSGAADDPGCRACKRAASAAWSSAQILYSSEIDRANVKRNNAKNNFYGTNLLCGGTAIGAVIAITPEAGVMIVIPAVGPVSAAIIVGIAGLAAYGGCIWVAYNALRDANADADGIVYAANAARDAAYSTYLSTVISCGNCP